MSWLDSLDIYYEHQQHIIAARHLWKQNHPGVPCNITKAAAEYSLSIGQPEDYLVMQNITDEKTNEKITVDIAKKTWRDRIYETLDKQFECPNCGRMLSFKIVPGCRLINKEGYSCLFYCYPDIVETEAMDISEDDDGEWCGYWVGILEPLNKAYNYIKDNGSYKELQHMEGCL